MRRAYSPIDAARKPSRRRTSSGWVRASNPAMRAVPDDGSRSVARQRSAVVFPAPLAPSSAYTSPASTRSERSCTAWKSPYRLVSR